MKLILKEEEIQEIIKKYVASKLTGNPEIIILPIGDIEFEFLVNYREAELKGGV